MKKLLAVFASLIIGTSVVAQIRVTGEMPDPNNVYNPPENVVSEKKTQNSLAGLYRLSDGIYIKDGSTTYIQYESDFMLNLTEIAENSYIGTSYGRLKFNIPGTSVDTRCESPNVVLFTVDDAGIRTSREIVKESKNCKIQKDHRSLTVSYQLNSDKLVVTLSAGQTCVVEPCGKLKKTVFIKNYDKTK